MKKITEDDIENLAIELLKEQGFQHFFGPDVAPDGVQPLRASYGEVLLSDKLQEAIIRLNPDIPASVREDAFNQIKRIHSEQLIVGNENFHKTLIEGIKVSVRKGSESRGDSIRLIDFQNPENNEYYAINQFTVIEDGHNHRPDIALFINGLPLVVIELKNPRDEKATIQSAYKQLQTYKKYIPSLFTYNSILVISDGLEAKAGSLSSRMDRFMAWKSIDGKQEVQRNVNQMETLTKGMLNKKTLLDLVRHFIVFEKIKKEDFKTGITNIETVKKLSAYHQYYATNKALESVIQASSESGSRKGGVIWHTQGSGKSLTMVFSAGKIVQELSNPTIVVITDRNDLDNQLFDTFAASKSLLRQSPVQAKNRVHLKELLKVVSGGIVFTTIQKFHPENGNVYEKLSDRKNIVVIADEAHRSQYGFRAKTIDDKDEEGNTVGQKTVYGFAKYMRDALPHATYLGFTGTPIEGTDKNTPAVFGSYVDVYDIAQAVEDKATVPISYESRLAKVELSQKGKQLIKDLDQELKEEELSETQKSKAKMTQLEAIIGSEDRTKHIAKDIVTHFEKRQSVFKGKGMIVTMSRRIAANLYNEIIKLRSEWHKEDLDKGNIKIIMTTSSSDGPELFKHHTSKEQRRQLADRMKDLENDLHLAIVVDMWLTGFDVPCLHTLYIDKPMQGHNLMQAIARVNRVYKDKPGGLVVDYLGIASDLKKALSFYSSSGSKGEPAVPQEKAVSLMLEKLEIVSQMFHGFNYKQYFTSDTAKKLSLILEAEEHILSLEEGRKRFIDQVTALSKAFALSIPHEKAIEVKDEVAFFQAVKARLVKFTGTEEGKTDVEIETMIRQVIDEALVSHKVIDVFSAAGIKKPDISILSDDFLLEVKNMKYKNIAIETLKKLLNDEIKGRAKRNIVQGKTLMEMLEDSIKRYHNKVITAVEVIEELIGIAKNIQSADEEPKAMNLSNEEYAFYTAVANNESARELMGKEQLRELAVALTDKVRKNASIDWQIKESVRAKIRVMVKRTLREYGYPPDMEKLATDKVLKQAECIADEISQS
ncbi:MAG: type I restriction endonuclease subunit R [Bdellovibrionales bacterium]|nr:type I restriction endonuclease subunit R [Bdellovibrionales bacterium]